MTRIPPAATAAVPTTAERLIVLRAVVAEWRGEWTTRRVQHLYVARFGPALWQSGARTARTDLAVLHRQGLLAQHDESGRRFYTLNSISNSIGCG